MCEEGSKPPRCEKGRQGKGQGARKARKTERGRAPKGRGHRVNTREGTHRGHTRGYV